MPQDPASIFGGLLARCISDESVEPEKKLLESVFFLLLGTICSVATTYALSAAGLLV